MVKENVEEINGKVQIKNKLYGYKEYQRKSSKSIKWFIS